MQSRKITELTWKEARADVIRVNPELASIIDKLNPDNNYKLIKASYLFGDYIVKDGVLQLPIDKALTPITSNALDHTLLKELNYATIPLSLLLNKSSEIFVTEDSRIIPLNIFKPGKLFGTFETLDYIFKKGSEPIWNVSAGARSLCMLPKISEASGFKRLRANYNLFSGANLKCLSDHWYVFKEIATHEKESQPWISHILIFGKEWLIGKENDPAWFQFQRYLFEQGWRQSQYAIDKIKFGLFWQHFVRAITHRNLKPAPYLSDTVKHLLLIATGSAPAFIAADESQLAAPTQILQEAFIDIYQLNHYLPTIIHPALLAENGSRASVYYSLALPTLLEGSPQSKSNTTLMLDIRDIKLMLETLLRAIDIKNHILSDIKFEYFHTEEDKFGEIQSSKLVPTLDDSFLTTNKYYKDRIFCATSSFWRGCIKISKS